MSQEGLQRRCEGQAGFGVGLHLVDAADLILDRVFHSGEVFVTDVELVQATVERGGFARTGRTGHQQHSVGFVDDGFPHDEVVVVESELVETQHDGALVENTHNGFLAVDRGHRRHTQVELASVVGKVDFSVLRDTPFGDVHIRHNLDTRCHRRLNVLGRAHHLVEHAVHPVAHLDRLGLGLDVNVGGLVVDGLGDDEVDDAHDRRFVDHLLELVDGQLLVGAVLVLERTEVLRGDVFHRLFDLDEVGHAELRVDGFDDGFFGRDHRVDVEPCDQADVIDGDDVERIHHRHGQSVVALGDRYDFIPLRQMLGDGPSQIRVDANLIHIHEAHSHLTAHGFDNVFLRNEAKGNENFLKTFASALRLGHGFVELSSGDELFVDQKLA